MKKPDLLNHHIDKLFYKFLFPSIGSSMVTSIYVLADTIMIGWGVGAEGIVALNILLPLFALFHATGYLFGIGGGVLMSVANGKSDKNLANIYFSASVFLQIVFSVAYFTVGTIFMQDIAYMLGATQNNIDLVIEYEKYLLWFSFVFMFSANLQSFVRNDNAPKHAMYSVISGGVLNIILDYILIFKFHMGMTGASVATVIGTSFTILLLLTHFLSRHNTMKLVKNVFDFKIVKHIFKSGFSSFLIELSAGTTIFLLNIQLIRYIGDIGVVAYGIISNVSFVALSLFNSVSQAAQPIMSINFGSNKKGRVLKVKKLGLITAGAFGLAVFIFGFLFPNQIVYIFLTPTPEILTLAQTAIRLYFVAFVLISLNLFYSTYFQAITMQRVSFTISVLRGFILNSLFVFLMPIIFGSNGLWLAIPISELITFLICQILNKKNPLNK